MHATNEPTELTPLFPGQFRAFDCPEGPAGCPTCRHTGQHVLSLVDGPTCGVCGEYGCLGVEPGGRCETLEA